MCFRIPLTHPSGSPFVYTAAVALEGMDTWAGRWLEGFCGDDAALSPSRLDEDGKVLTPEELLYRVSAGRAEYDDVMVRRCRAEVVKTGCRGDQAVLIVDLSPFLTWL